MNENDRKSRELFLKYYEGLDPALPDLLSSREIGFIPFGGTMVRHRALSGKDELRDFLLKTVPRHLYYSTAYYRYPENKKMDLKEWLGAELIFDLDADHIPGADKLPYEEILSQVKKHTERLVFKYLMDDFGFTEDEIHISFSGGRGYHVHILSEKVYMLDSDSRREIANFIRGEGLDQKNFIYEMRKQSNADRGWFKAIDDAYTEFNRRIASGDDETLQELNRCLGNKNSSRAFVNALKSGVRVEKRIEKKEAVFTKPGIEKYEVMDQRDEQVLQTVLRSTVQANSSEIDEPVTTDIHRLIRFPLSLHGKTGLKVLPMSLSEFGSFDPLRDAVPECFRVGMEKVNMRTGFRIRYGEDLFELDQGLNEVPQYVALFVAGIGLGQFNLE